MELFLNLNSLILALVSTSIFIEGYSYQKMRSDNFGKANERFTISAPTKRLITYRNRLHTKPLQHNKAGHY
jgi:hypothetical protein